MIRENDKKLIKILFSKDILWSFLFLIIFSIISSSSNIWLSNLGSSITNGVIDLIYYYFTLFTASLFLANIPEAISRYYLARSKLNAIQNYTQEFTESHKNTVTSTFDTKVREEKEAWLNGEADKTLDETFTVIHNSISMTLSSVFNMATLAIAIDSKLVIGYLISFVSIPLLLKYMNGPIKTLSLQSQKDRNSLRQVFLSSWENISIGNNYNFKVWNQEFLGRLNILRKSYGRFTLLFSLSNSATTFVIMSPVIFNIFWLINTNINDPVKLTVIAATFYKQIGTLFNIHTLFTNTIDWTSNCYPRLCALVESIKSPLPRTHIENNIKLNEITFTIDKRDYTIDSIKEILQMINTKETGRITIKGSNGSGKSTLLCLLKEILDDKAFYLPASSMLVFEDTKKANLSSGQKVKRQLNELLGVLLNQPDKIVLLDEWDANLDQSSAQDISNQIDQLSKTNLIFEVRHKIIVTQIFSLPHTSLSIPTKQKEITLFFSSKSNTFNRGLNFTLSRSLNYSKKETVIDVESEDLIDSKLTKKINYKRGHCQLL